jgi:hypothetical protein
MVAHSSRYISGSWAPDLRIAGVRPMASSAEKPVRRVKAGLTEAITPSESVMTIAFAAAATAITCSCSSSFDSSEAELWAAMGSHAGSA